MVDFCVMARLAQPKPPREGEPPVRLAGEKFAVVSAISKDVTIAISRMFTE
jgi:hypothetical protein